MLIALLVAYLDHGLLRRDVPVPYRTDSYPQCLRSHSLCIFFDHDEVAGERTVVGEIAFHGCPAYTSTPAREPGLTFPGGVVVFFLSASRSRRRSLATKQKTEVRLLLPAPHAGIA